VNQQSPLEYEEAKRMANDPDPAVRRSLAGRSDLKPELLYFLAEDEDKEVRRRVAANAAAPRQTHDLLARDADDEVRQDLAGKLARIAPGLSSDERTKLRQSTHETLALLASDQVTKVRQILSETLKDVTNVPADVIKRLAMDTELVVAGPVLEYSPILTDDDLIEIINFGPAKGGLSSISKRRGVGENVADAIVATDDIHAIADLLGNDTAQIREQALDDLISRADSIELWHAPLVSRPTLPSGAASRLALFVADNLLDQLTARSDLDGDTLEAVKSVIHRRLGDRGEVGTARPDLSSDFMTIDPPVDIAKRLLAAGRLDERVISRALHSDDHAFVLAALAVRAELPIETAQKIFASHSAKGIVSLTWKAGFPAKLAAQLQQRMAAIIPDEVLKEKDDGNFPLSEDEMNWQIGFHNE